jgi:hypothetical protein
VSIVIFKDEASANSRTVPMRIFLSDGTSPDTGASNDSIIMVTPSAATFVPDVKLAAVHSAQGMYAVVLTQSNVSLCGTNALYHTQGDFCQHVANINIVAYNPYDAKRLALSDITLGPRDYGSDTTFGVSTIKAGTYSGVTVGSLATIPAGDYSSSITFGVSKILAGTYSGVTVGSLATIPAGDYSSTITFGVGLIKPATYSGVTVGINNIAAGNYSGVTISGVTTTNNLDKSGYGVTSIAAGTYSGVTVGSAATILAGGIVATSFGASAIDAVALATDAGQEIADRILVRSIAGGADSGRTVGTALYVLRNKVDASASVGTVYQTDDATSAFTFSITTGTFPIATADPT